MSTPNFKHVPFLGLAVKFFHRDVLKQRAERNSVGSFRLPRGSLPTVTLPIDNTGNQAVSCPIDGNDVLGDCGEAMAAHCDNIWTFGQGKSGFTQSVFDQSALANQYLAVSGGDNGLDENMVVNQIWKTPGIAGNSAATIVDSYDIDVTNTALAQFALANNFLICMAWSVPDDFIQNFSTGVKFLNADTPDPNNGHFTPLADVDASGNYSLYTWGSYAWVSPSFIASVQPQCFVVFSTRSFNAQGYDSKGRHISTQAAVWHSCTGNAIPASVINAFPPAVAPTPGPTPVPSPTPTPTPTPVPVSASAFSGDLAAKTISLPSGYTSETAATNQLLSIDEVEKIFFLPAGYKVVPSSASIAGLVNWTQVLQIIEQLLAVLGPILNPPAVAKLNAMVEHAKANPTAINWAQILKLIETIISVIAPFVPVATKFHFDRAVNGLEQLNPKAINIIQIIQIIQAILAALGPIFNPPSPPPSKAFLEEHVLGRFRAVSVAGFVSAPQSVDDVLNNNDIVQGALAYLASVGITDSAVVAALEAVGKSALVAGASAILAYEQSATKNVPQSVTHNGLEYEVDPTQTPPSLVASNAIPAAQVPVVVAS